MRSRIFFAGIAVFWLVMNYLLWRSQSAAHSQIGSAIPVEIVWDKILTAPDNSALEIYDHDKKIGYCQWTASVGNSTQFLNQSLADDYAPDGSNPQPTGYALNLEGNTSVFGTNRARFEMHLRLSTNQTWQDFRFSGKMRPVAVDLHASASIQKMMVKVTSDNGNWQRLIKFSELEHPETLLGEMAGGDMLGVIGAALPLAKNSAAQAGSAFKWEAHEDWMKFGHSRVRVYRLETELFGQHLYIFTSRVGEILWVEAPNKLTLRNEAFSHF